MATVVWQQLGGWGGGEHGKSWKPDRNKWMASAKARGSQVRTQEQGHLGWGEGLHVTKERKRRRKKECWPDPVCLTHHCKVKLQRNVDSGSYTHIKLGTKHLTCGKFTLRCVLWSVKPIPDYKDVVLKWMWNTLNECEIPYWELFILTTR